MSAVDAFRRGDLDVALSSLQDEVRAAPDDAKHRVFLFQLLAYSVIINCILALFNLIPIPPLDGSRIFAMLLPANLRTHFARIERFGMIIILVLLVTGPLSWLMSFFLKPLLDFLLGS